MKQITLGISNSKLDFFKELIKNFDFVKLIDEKDIDLTQEQSGYVEGLKKSLLEVDDHLSKKTKLQPAKDFLREL